jgi:hypothetical protein
MDIAVLRLWLYQHVIYAWPYAVASYAVSCGHHKLILKMNLVPEEGDWVYNLLRQADERLPRRSAAARTGLQRFVSVSRKRGGYVSAYSKSIHFGLP